MSNTDEIRWQQRLENFGKAISQLETACSRDEYSDLERAGLVQMFEFSFELAWKTLKDLLFSEGYDEKTPRSVIRRSFEVEAQKLIRETYFPVLLRVYNALKDKQNS